MNRVEIYVHNGPSWGVATRTAEWTGDVDWPGAPLPGSSWSCCGDYAAETVHAVTFNWGLRAGLTLEIATDDETVSHLVEDHGWQIWADAHA